MSYSTKIILCSLNAHYDFKTIYAQNFKNAEKA